MKQYKTRTILNYAKWAVIITVLSGIFIKHGSLSVRIVNAFTIGGLVMAAIGGLGFAGYLGGFELFSYSFKKLRRYSRKNKDLPDEDDVGSYYDYINSRRKTLDFLIPLAIGAVFIAISLCIGFLCKTI